MLNLIWVSFFLVAFVLALWQSLVLGQGEIWTQLISSTFASAKTAFTISLNLTGILCLWLGLLKVAEKSGITAVLAKALRPLFRKIMPEVPADSPAMGSMIMNIAANVLGLDNAATPMGLKAMEQLQTLNPHKDRASDAQILFMVINSSAVTLIPITILMYRSELGAANPSAVFMPILFATSLSTLAGFLAVAVVQRLNVFNRVVMAYLGGFILFIGVVAFYFCSLPETERLSVSANCGNFLLFAVIVAFIGAGVVKKLNVYETFVVGAKEGFEIAVRIIPYLVAMLVAIAVFRASGALDFLVEGFAAVFGWLGIDTGFVAALPTALLKPLSGSGARAMMIETMTTYGADSFPAFVSAVVQGSTETTFYVLAVYFGAVKITKVGAALPCALFADFVGIASAICFSYLFY
ncbi:MAG: nucleoside recognition domain-containing protein [Alphaproteobacteria bacterium]|jgi:transporter gate domain protein|nr:spore maturation protein [Alphaproteobacteria bacterium]